MITVEEGDVVTLQDIELLAGLLQRAGVNPYEAFWANMIINKLRAMVAGITLELLKKKESEEESDRTELGSD